MFKMNDIDWKEMQYSLKQLHFTLTDVQNKEIEMQKVLNSSLNLYYKCKRKIFLYIKNTLGFLGLNRTYQYNDTIKVDIKTANSEELYIFGPLKDYLLLFRNNLNNLFRFTNIITNEEQDTISFLLMHFFYEDITLNESSDVLNFIYKNHLTNELNNYCDCFYLDNFINPSSFTAKLTKQLLHRNEVKLYISHLLSSLINDFEEFYEKNDKVNIVLDIDVLENCLKKKNVIPGGPEKDDDSKKKLLFIKSKTTIGFSNNIPEMTKINDSESSLAKRQSVFGVPEKKQKGIEILNDNKINHIFNTDYDYTEKTLKNLLKKVDNTGYKLIYLRQLKQINNSHCKNMFSIKPFREKMKKLVEYKKIFSYYNENYKTIKYFISSLINNIIKYKDFTPKLVNTAYKAIYSFFRINYQNINSFDMNLFMINYLFEYIVIPTLKCPEVNELLVKEKIFNYKTHKDLIPIINILRHIAQCYFFIEDDYKILNTFIVEQHYYLQNFFIDLTSSFDNQIYLDQVKYENIFTNENYQTMCLSREEIKIFIDHFKEMEFEDEKGDLAQMVEDSTRLTEDKRTDKFSTQQYFVFTNLNYNGERKNALKIEKKKEKNTSFVGEGEEMLFVENIKNCINYVLVNCPPIPNELTNAEFGELFNRLNSNIFYHKDEYKDTFGNKNIPLAWYSNYIINIMEKLPQQYQRNNYLLLYTEMNSEIKEQREKIANKNDVLSIDLSGEINTFKKMVKIYKHQLKLCKTLDLNSKVVYFIKNAQLPICLMTAKDKFDSVYSLFGKEASKPFMEGEAKEILIDIQSNCIHAKYETKTPKLSFVDQSNIKQLKSICHVNTIKEFNKKIQEYIGDITADIFSKITDSQNSNTNKTKANEVIEKYINFIDDILKDNYKHFFISKESKSADKKQKIFLKKIHSYILRKISLGLRKHGSSYFIILEDKKFKDKCLELRWLDPVENLTIDPSMVSNAQINLGRELIKKMDKERAGPRIIKYFSKAVNLMVKMITFTTGREDISIDDFLPIMVYLFISVGPGNVISNFGSATYFLLSDEENENTGYSLANIEGCINFIKQYSEVKCGMSKEEFTENCKKSLQKYCITEYLYNNSKKTEVENYEYQEEQNQIINNYEEEGNYINEGENKIIEKEEGNQVENKEGDQEENREENQEGNQEINHEGNEEENQELIQEGNNIINENNM